MLFAVCLHQNQEISPGNLLVLKHAKKEQILSKLSKHRANFRSTNTVCLDMANHFFMVQTLVNLSKPDF